MKTKIIKVLTEQWFTKASFDEVRMLAIKHLNIPANTMNDSHKPEVSRRALARQVFVKSHQYGEEFDIIESNPFGAAPKRTTKSSTNNNLTGEYRFVKCGMRAPEGDIRWEMMKLLEENSSFEKVLADWDKTMGVSTKFKNTGKIGTFNFIDMIQWALTRGWIVRV